MTRPLESYDILGGPDRADLKPLEDIKPVDSRTATRDGGWPRYLNYAYRSVANARLFVPPDPYESEVLDDHFLIKDLDRALSCLKTVAMVSGITLTLTDDE